MKIFYTILSVFLAAYMTLAPIIWNAQPADNNYFQIQEFKIHSFESPAITVAAISIKTAPSQIFLWAVLIQNSFKHPVDTFSKFICKKDDFLLSPFLRNTIYVYVSINAP
ncbi:hypothetical protein BH23BAC1_BH23BAC1_30870 [soil metagenome]